MVFIIDEGSTFKAPIEKVWKLNMSEGNHEHPTLKNASSEMEGEHPVLSYESQMPDGSWAKNRVKLTLLPPIGVGFQTIEGPMTGSTSFQYYSPKGNETGITVIGEWTAKGVPDDNIRQAVLGFLDAVFKEDQANLAKMS
jgi:hypothetical protein